MRKLLRNGISFILASEASSTIPHPLKSAHVFFLKYARTRRSDQAWSRISTAAPPTRGSAEAYSMGRLTAAEAASFEMHYMACPTCAEVVRAADAYAWAMRDAA